MARALRLRYEGKCAACSAGLPRGSEAWWDSVEKKAWCMAHGDSAMPEPALKAPTPAEAGEATAPATPRRLKVRYAGSCGRCGTQLAAKSEAFWHRETKELVCVPCESPPVKALGAEVPARRTAHQDDLLGTRPGGSADAEYERRRTKDDAPVRARFGRFPRLAELIIKVRNETPATAAWGKGARGEAALGTALGSLPGVQVLHDRLRPRSGRANIDHIVVAPTGVWVIDAKHYSGKVEQVNRGTFFRPVHELKVGGRRRTDKAREVKKQVAAVKAALVPEHPDVAVRGVLCFIGGEWDFLAPPFEQEGILVIWPPKLYKLLAQPGPLDGETIRSVQLTLSRSLPSAVEGR